MIQTTPSDRLKLMQPSYAALWVRSLTKLELETLISDVKRGDATATSQAVIFVTSESFGYWHNRARAKLCRHFKNHRPSATDCERMVKTIVDRFLNGRFYEQFKDQLSMAIRFSPDDLERAASIAAGSDRDYIRRYATWVRHVLDSQSPTTQTARQSPNTSKKVN